MARNLDRGDDGNSSVSAEDDQARPQPNESRRTRLSRRSYVKFGAAVTALLSATTVNAAGTAAVRRDGIEFQTVYDAVDDLGMDPTGQESIDEAIAATEDRSLIQFPDGNYRFGAHPASVSLVGNTRGFEGAGDDVSFLAPGGKRQLLFDETQLEEVYLANIEIDQRGAKTCAGLRLFGDRVVVRDIDVVGSCDRRAGGVPLLSHATLSPGGSSLLENVVSTEHSEVRAALGRPGISLDRAHSGTAVIRGCDLRGFPDPAIDGAHHGGRVRITDSYFENNASSIRISNHGSTIERCEILVTKLPAPVPAANDNQFHINGIAVARDENRVRHRHNTPHLKINDTTLRIEEVPGSCPAIVVPSAGGPLALENVDIEFNNDDRAVILGRAPGANTNARIRQLRIQDLSIRGDGRVDSALVLNNADDSRISDSTVVMPDGGTDGITVDNSGRITIEKTGIQVTDRAIAATSTEGRIRQVSPGPTRSDTESTDRWRGGRPDAAYRTTAAQMADHSDRRFRLAGPLDSLTLRGDTVVSFAKTPSEPEYCRR